MSTLKTKLKNKHKVKLRKEFMEKEVRYIIPRNYDFKPKLFGLIEYRLGVFVTGLILVLILIFHNINIPAILKIQIIIVINMPILMLGTIGVRGESLFDIIKLLLSYYFKQKIYFYEKENFNK